ncbi:MAG: KEOPS complex subunit Pcc1 [Candidatus Methanomethylophilaceae archaeon]|nr:complex subunit Pcc1 [Candidatus Methanomethylophilaceae archaeon]
MLTAVLVIGSGDADNIVASVGPETGDLPRTHVTVRSEGGSAVVEIAAADSSAMRAALNSYLECIAITEDIENIIR